MAPTGIGSIPGSNAAAALAAGASAATGTPATGLGSAATTKLGGLSGACGPGTRMYPAILASGAL